MPMEIKRSLRNSVLLLTLTYGSKTWTWNRAQQSRVEISYLRGAYGVMRWDGESSESVYERCGMENSCKWSGGMSGKKKLNGLGILRGWGVRSLWRKRM